MIRFVKKLLLRCNTTKIALFLDNASYHKSRETYDFLMQYHHKENVKLQWCYNAVGRPDLNGIENYWGLCKQIYRRRVTANLVSGTDWNNYDMVVNILQEIEKETVCKVAYNGWKKLFHAELMPHWWNLQVYCIEMPYFAMNQPADIHD